MALKLLKDFTVTSGNYVNIIDSTNPLTVEQDGSVDDINLVPYKAFYIYNDGKRTDDGYTATGVYFKYQSVVITPKPFTTTVKTGSIPTLSTGTSSRIYITETSKQVPGGTGDLKINTGTVLKATIGAETEKMLVKKVGWDSASSSNYVDVIRNYKNDLMNPLNLVNDTPLTASVEHIYLSNSTNFNGITGGSALSIADITNEITNPNSNTAHPDVAGKYQTIYVKAVPQLNKISDTASPNYLGRIPTQFKTDVYFEVAYRELPDTN